MKERKQKIQLQHPPLLIAWNEKKERRRKKGKKEGN
jgi:hypothetical protein